MSESEMSGLMPFRQEDGRVGFMRKRVQNLTQKEKIFLEEMAVLREQQDKLAMEFMEGKETFAVEGKQINEA